MANGSPSVIARGVGAGRRLASMALRPLRGNTSPRIWEGVFERFADVPVADESYATPAYLNDITKTAAALIDDWRAGKRLTLWHDHLALVAACSAAAGRRVRIVDFGGGLGSGYLHLRQNLPNNITLDYVIVEIPELVARGKTLFAGFDEIAFCETIEDAPVKPDIVYINSALQYVDDYCAVLRRLAKLRPAFVLLDRTAAGDVPSFVTRQLNMDGKAMRYWFLNKGEIADVLAAAEFRLIHETEVGPVYDQRALPVTHRIPRMRSLLFAATEEHVR